MVAAEAEEKAGKRRCSECMSCRAPTSYRTFQAALVVVSGHEIKPYDNHIPMLHQQPIDSDDATTGIASW